MKQIKLKLRKLKQRKLKQKKLKKRKPNFNYKLILLILLIIVIVIFYIFYPDFFNFKRLADFNILNFSSMSSKNITICLCVIAKRENLYAKEYVNHYKKLGYQHIYIYDNNDVDGEKFEDVIQDEINSGFVTIINIRGLEKGQCYAYKDCYEKYNRLYNWMSFFDFDEFLAIKENNIQNFLTSSRYKECVTIKINFLFYSDNELLYYDKRPLEERFTNALYKHHSNVWLKVTVRGGLKTNYWSVKCSPHTSGSNYPACNSAGKKIPYWTGYARPNFTYAAMKHYYTKSTEEYLIKSSRGSATNKVSWNKRRKKFKYNLYFYYNKKTKEKEKLLKRLFNMT